MESAAKSKIYIKRLAEGETADRDYDAVQRRPITTLGQSLRLRHRIMPSIAIQAQPEYDVGLNVGLRR